MQVRAFAMGPTQRCCIHTHTLMHTHQIHCSPTQPEPKEGHGRGRMEHWLQRFQVPAWHTSLRSWASSWTSLGLCLLLGQDSALHCGPRTWSSSWFCPLEADQRDISPPESPWTPGLRLSNNFVTSKYFQQSLPKELSNSLKPFEGRCLYYGRISFWGGSQSYMESK